MFGSGFDLGFGVTDLQGGIAGFIGLAPVAMLIIAVLVLMFVPRLVGVLRSVVMDVGDHDGGLPVGWGVGEYNDEVFEMSDGDMGYDEWQGGVGRVSIGDDEFWYSNDSDSSYVA